MHKIIRTIIGWSLIIVGIIGLFVPFIQGIALVIAGFVVLENKPVLNWINRIKEKWHARKNQKK